MQIEVSKTIKLEVTEVNPEFAREVGYCIVGGAKDGQLIHDVIRAPNKALAAEAFINKHLEKLQVEPNGGYAIGFLPATEFEVKLA